MTCFPPLGSRYATLFAAAVLSWPLMLQAADGDFVWIEGEDAVRKDVTRHPWYNSVKTAELSGGEWLSNYGPSAGTAEYEVEIPTGGD